MLFDIKAFEEIDEVPLELGIHKVYIDSVIYSKKESGNEDEFLSVKFRKNGRETYTYSQKWTNVKSDNTYNFFLQRLFHIATYVKNEGVEWSEALKERNKLEFHKELTDRYKDYQELYRNLKEACGVMNELLKGKWLQIKISQTVSDQGKEFVGFNSLPFADQVEGNMLRWDPEKDHKKASTSNNSTSLSSNTPF